MKNKIFIIGNDINAFSLAKKLADTNEVFITSSSDAIKDFATAVDIREDDVKELLEFVVENDIDITIPVGNLSLKSAVVDCFMQNQQSVFGPSAKMFDAIFDKMFVKKMLYKLRIPTPRFGIFEKQNMALDYIKNLKQPFVIKNNDPSSAVILNSQNTAKKIIESFNIQANQKILIEDYVWGTPFSFYVITDGYKALPIGSSITYRHFLNGDGGQLTNGMGACAPNYKLSLENEYFLMDNVVYPILEYLESESNHYLGILGIDGVLTEDGKIQILGLKPFMQNCDTTGVLELLDVDILNLMKSCIVGSFSDEFDFIPQKDLFATSVVLYCKNKENNQNVISGLELLDEDIKVALSYQICKNRYLEYEAEYGPVMLLTAFARTVTSSCEKVYEELENIKFRGLYYRKDIAKPTRIVS